MMKMLGYFCFHHGKVKRILFCGLSFKHYNSKALILEKQYAPIVGASVGVPFCGLEKMIYL